MRAAWWWIDRWRKSTAYTDMTLAEQGAYRNLLDELWLRGGLLPDDDRVLAKVSGDALEWPKVRAKVMARFQRTPEGWRNETHDEVVRGSGRQAEKGQKRASAAPRSGGRFTSRAPAGVPAEPPAGHQPNDQPNDQPLNQPEAPAAHQPPSPSPSPTDNGSTYLPTARASVPESPFPEQLADDATKAAIRTLQSKFGGLLARLAEHPKSRRMVPAWCKVCTAYDKPGVGRMDGVSDYRTVFSIERLERSIRDAEWNLEQLDRQLEVQHGA